MFLKKWYEKIYNAVFSLSFFKKLLKIPGVEKLLQYEFVSYIFFGVLTTVVNLVAYWAVNLFAGPDYETKVLFTVKSFDFRWIYFANAVAWIVAVLFSYFTTKIFVFESRSFAAKTLVREMVSFFGARILSFLIFEELVFGILASFMNSWIAKIIIAVFVVVFNYVASKLVIFKKKKTDEIEEGNTPEINAEEAEEQ
ncbi:MAG: GtrA family protein [Clostridia bacterium]|nr:GtrA family protein [Clostridia bacterium]